MVKSLFHRKPGIIYSRQGKSLRNFQKKMNQFMVSIQDLEDSRMLKYNLINLETFNTIWSDLTLLVWENY